MNPGDNVFKAIKILIAIAIVGAVSFVGFIGLATYMALK